MEDVLEELKRRKSQTIPHAYDIDDRVSDFCKSFELKLNNISSISNCASFSYNNKDKGRCRRSVYFNGLKKTNKKYVRNIPL